MRLILRQAGVKFFSFFLPQIPEQILFDAYLFVGHQQVFYVIGAISPPPPKVYSTHVRRPRRIFPVLFADAKTWAAGPFSFIALETENL